jgi:DNA-binding CsgD family transcriptional regulator
MATDPFDRHAEQLKGRRSECEVLARLVDAVSRGESRAIVLRGEPGIGKTALLDYVAEQASHCRVVRAAGIQSELELAFAALHQLCASFLDRLERLPAPQRDALQTAFGIRSGTAPDRFLVALAVLNLLSEVAEERPLLCLIDDEQWLDRASAQALGFVARRVHSESVGVVFAARQPSGEVAGLQELLVDGLSQADSRELLDSMLTGPLDPRIRDQIISETRGNPLALRELPRGMRPGELAGGFGLPAAISVSRRIEESFERQFGVLPVHARRLLQLAAADPTGDRVLIGQAAERLGIPAEAVTPAVDAGLAEFGLRVRFRHPLVRSAAYRSMSLRGRQEVHRALAEVTDADMDPDRRAWHRAQAASGPDEDVAAELERSAQRAQARGGLAAAAAFHQRAAELTPEPARRAQRLLAAAGASRDAGALDESLELLIAAEAGPWEARRSAEVERLRGQIAFDQRRYAEAAPLLLEAARRLEPVDASAAREAHLEALLTAMWAGGQSVPGDLRRAGEAARAAPRGPEPPRASDLLLDAFALLLTEGYPAALPTMRLGLDRFLALNIGDDEVGGWLWRASSRAAGIAALELWDYECWHRLAREQALFARDTGALVHLQSSLGFLGWTHVVAGELDAAALLVKESRLVAEATTYSPIAHTAMMLAAWRGQTPSALGVIEGTVRDLTASGLGTVSSSYASSVLYNGLGRYEDAREAAREAFECDPVGYGPLIVSEMAEAASRTGDLALVRMALDWLKDRTRLAPAGWALGIEARVGALISEGDAAEELYRQSIEHLGRTRVQAELARSHLLYGEWLRRENRRLDAREPLRAAHEMLLTMGAEAFAERARRELLATGEKVRRRTMETRDDLTAQEEQIARLARAGLSNPEIGARLFLSPRTVEWHLRKVFTKLEIRSRRELLDALPTSTSELAPA